MPKFGWQHAGNSNQTVPFNPLPYGPSAAAQWFSVRYKQPELSSGGLGQRDLHRELPYSSRLPLSRHPLKLALIAYWMDWIDWMDQMDWMDWMNQMDWMNWTKRQRDKETKELNRYLRSQVSPIRGFSGVHKNFVKPEIRLNPSPVNIIFF